MKRADGQVSVLLVAALLAVIAGALVLGGVARWLSSRSDVHRAADLAALAGARAMHAAYPRLFDPGAAHLPKPSYLAIGRAAAARVARVNGARVSRVEFPDGETFAPVRIRVTATASVSVGEKRVAVRAIAEAELVPDGGDGGFAVASGSGYDGPLALRQGKGMRPDVAAAFDRMNAAASAAGVPLIITSAYRSDAEQAVLFARRPDPRWVAPPGRSLHRYGTELDLGPAAAYGWLAANAPRFRFVRRYAWEPWHYGYALNARSTPRGGAAAGGSGTHPPGTDRGARAADGQGSGTVPAFVPARFAPALARAAQRWNVSATLLAAQTHAESGFNPFAVSPSGARGLAQFTPGTARAYGLRNPHDPAAALDAQARLMRDLLREFASVPLALAAYNAGPARVRACHCVPPIPETRGYVARILGLMTGAGEADVGGLVVRLVR